ncbi:hypothetical protein DL95DRAFT_406068 [Leptodontidium sp. 2 PMI_412]|nr:hypothetical protein DL95DRAFT_406068 [Leptodontidium sp. 2 PMI_412]
MSPQAVSDGVLGLDLAPKTVVCPCLAASNPTTPRPSTPTKATSAMTPPGPTTPVKATGLPSIMVTAPTPTSASSSPRIATGRTLTRSGTIFDFAAALAENTPSSSSSSNAQQASSSVTTTEPSLSATNASAANFLAPPPKNTKHPSREEPGSVKSSVIAHFIACGSPFGVRVWDENAKYRLDVTPGEIRTLAQVYGETMEWTMNIEEIYCRECVRECKVVNETEYKNSVNQFLERSPNLLKAYLCLHGRHNPGSCNHRNGISQLMRDVGVQDATRIRRIVVTSSDDSFQVPDKVSSAIGIIVQSFPNIQKATVKIRSDESLIADGVAGKLARAFALLEKHLPEEEGVVVRGLERQRVLEGKWKEVRRGWWERRRAFGRKVLG